MAKLTQIGRWPWVLGWLLLCLQVNAVQAESLQASEVTNGSLVTRDEEGRVMAMPLLDTKVKMKVVGPLLRAEVTQTFRNPGDR